MNSLFSHVVYSLSGHLILYIDFISECVRYLIIHHTILMGLDGRHPSQEMLFNSILLYHLQPDLRVRAGRCSMTENNSYINKWIDKYYNKYNECVRARVCMCVCLHVLKHLIYNLKLLTNEIVPVMIIYSNIGLRHNDVKMSKNIQRHLLGRENSHGPVRSGNQFPF